MKTFSFLIKKSLKCNNLKDLKRLRLLLEEIILFIVQKHKFMIEHI